MSFQSIIGLAILTSMAIADPGSTFGDERTHYINGQCQRVRGAGVCTCSLPMIETELSFGEAAGIIELYFYHYPDESQVELLSRLLRQCSGTLPSIETSPPIVLRQDNQPALSAFGRR